MLLPPIIKTIAKTLGEHHAKAIIVGGSVRDHFLDLPIKDYDIEVFGLENMDLLENILCEYGTVNLVGKSFGVLKFMHEGEVYDFSFPRREQKIGLGHRGFDVEVDAKMDFTHASLRRDFTVNALGYDVQEQRFIDPHGGREDMKHQTLRHIDDSTFIEDPLRVYRAVQFCARFGYTLAEETFVLCKHMVQEGVLEELPKERVYAEFKKLLLKSPKPSLGFELMRALGILRYFPELQKIIDVPQSPKWHPEGDVWIHTMMSIDVMVTLLGKDEKLNLKYMFAILCHDLGKATCTTIEQNGHIKSIGHEYEGLKPTKTFMYKLTEEHDFIKGILLLVAHHLKPRQFHILKASDKAFRKLATQINIEELVVVAKADFLGRTTKKAKLGIYDAGEWMLEKAKALKVQNKALDNLLQGRDLIRLGMKPSAKFKEVLDSVYSLQIEGAVSRGLGLCEE